MHIMEGYLPPMWCAIWLIISAVVVIYGIMQIKKVTAENDDITKEEIKEYILKVYPDFASYMNLMSTLSVIEYRKILSELNVEVCEFHIMPHLLK